MSADVARYREALAPVEEAARLLPWARERRWRAASHVGAEGELAVVDLHDLSAALAREAVTRVGQHPPEVGAVVFVHGRGRRSTGPAVLGGVVESELRRVCGPVAGWSYRKLGASRTAWITDWQRAPAAATGRGAGCWLWLLAALLLVGLALGLARSCAHGP